MTNSQDEGTMFVMNEGVTNEERYLQFLRQYFRKEDLEEIYAIYGPHKFNPVGSDFSRGLSTAVADFLFKCPALEYINRILGQVPVRYHVFDKPLPAIQGLAGARVIPDLALCTEARLHCSLAVFSC